MSAAEAQTARAIGSRPLLRSARPLLFAGLHLFVLSSFALAQPLFGVLERAPEFFVVRGSTRLDVVAFALGLTLVPPALLFAVEALVRLAGARVWTVTHLVFVAALVGVIALQVLKRLADGPAFVLISAAALAGALAAFAYARARAARLFLTVLAPAPLVFAGLFLLHSPVAKITLGTDVATAAVGDAGAKTPLVFVLFDELPISSLMDARGRIDRGRYPSFAALADDATWFRNATTAHEHSTEAVPALLTGREPDEVKLPVLADHPRNLFTLLPESYRFDVFESATRLCPSERCPRREEPFLRRMSWLSSDVSDVYLQILLPDELAERLPPVTQTWMNFGDEGESRRRADAVRYDAQIDVMVGHEFSKDQVLLFETFVSGVAPTRKPTLHFLHVLLPHSPWQYLPSGARYPNGIAIDGLDIDTWWKNEWLVTQGWQRHLLQTMYVDRLLGRLLDRLRATGLYDRSLVVVLADHGVSFRPGERRRGATGTNLHDIAFVPLFVKKPFQREPRVEDKHVEALDILPSLADVLDLPVPAGIDGASFFSRSYTPDDEVRVYRRAGEPPVVRPFTSLLRPREATVAEQSALFGSGSAEKLFEIGPHARALVGRPLDSLRLGRPSPLEAELVGGSRLADVDLSSGVIPARIAGTLEGEGARGGLALAVALNGRIAATTRSYEDGDAVRFSALVPEAALRDGANDVGVFLSAKRRGALVLEPVHLG